MKILSWKKCIFAEEFQYYTIMPKIFEYFGFIFYFYSNEHEPIHVHVMHGARESIFDLIMMDGELAELHVRDKKGADPLPEKDKRTAEAFIRKYHKNIIDKWVKFFVMKQSIRGRAWQCNIMFGKTLHHQGRRQGQPYRLFDVQRQYCTDGGHRRVHPPTPASAIQQIP